MTHEAHATEILNDCPEGCLCRCHGDDEDPGPHLATCAWANPHHGETNPEANLATATKRESVEAIGRLVGFDRGVRDMDPRAAIASAAIAAGGFPRAVAEQAIAEGEAELLAEANARREALDDRTMLHGHTPPAGVWLADYPETPAGSVVQIVPGETFARVIHGEPMAAPRCPVRKIASATQAAQCVRELHDGDEHDFRGAVLEERARCEVTGHALGSWDVATDLYRRADEEARAVILPQSMVHTSHSAAEKDAFYQGDPIALECAEAAESKAMAIRVGSGPWNPLPGFTEPKAGIDHEYPEAKKAGGGLVGIEDSPYAKPELRAHVHKHRPWFLTLTGRQFFYDDPESYPFTVAEIAHALSNLCRFAGHLRDFYSVAEHSVLVAQALEREAVIVLEEPGDMRPMLRAALLHDASEAFLMDLPRPLKRLPGLEGYRVLEDRVQLAILRTFGLEDWHEREAIKRADTAVLAAEKVQLRDPHPFGERQDINDQVKPAAVTCRSLPPNLARAVFLASWQQLGGA